MRRARNILTGVVLTAAILIPIVAAASSPLLAWRGPAYIAAGFAGVVAMSFLLIQPLLAGGYLSVLSKQRARQAHRLIGCMLVTAIVVHVGGLWITSPPDVIDALLFRSPTPFSAWGVVAMWAMFAAAVLAAFRRRLHLRFHVWRNAHLALAAITAVGSVVHALLIEGTMETYSKAALCALVLGAVLKLAIDLLQKNKQ